LKAIVSELTEVSSITLTDLDDHLKYRLDVFDSEEEDSELPNIKDWLGELAINEKPWWDRSDESTWDGIAKNKEELDRLKEVKQEEREGVSMFEDIEESILNLFKAIQKEANGAISGEIIEVDFQQETKKKSKKWKPTLI